MTSEQEKHTAYNELESLLQEIKPIVSGLSELDPDQLTPQECEERNRAMQEVQVLGMSILCEQIDIVMQELHDIVTRVEAEAKQQREADRLERELAAVQAEIVAVSAELAKVEARIFADNVHFFTIVFPTFPGPTVALLEVRGAANQESARAIARSCFKDCRYAITDGDYTNGQAAYLYTWASAAAQEARA